MAFRSALAEALRLTRAGNPAEAARLIQTMLTGPAPEATAASPTIADGPIPATAASLRPAPAERDQPAGAADPAPPAVGTIAERKMICDAGTLSYRLYLPATVAEGMPIVVMLHGCTQSPEDFARGTRMDRLADEFGVIVAYPRQTSAANMQKCWNWFRPEDQQRDRGEPALIAAIAREVLHDERGDPLRVYVAGLSAGGAAALVLGGLYPDLFAAVGVHSGVAAGAANGVTSALSAMRSGARGRALSPAGGFVPTISFHGDTDTTVDAINANEIIAAAAAHADRPIATRIDAGTSAGGRRYTRAVGTDDAGHTLIEQWTIHGAGHAWAGGDGGGSYTDPAGPDASREMLRFFLGHRRADAGARNPA